MQKKDIINLLNVLLKSLQFKKRGNNWCLEGQDIIKIVNLQKSNYGNFYYINYGYILKNIELGRLNMHIYNRLSSNNPNENNRIKELLDFDNSINDEVRIKEFTYYIKKEILEKFNQIVNEDDILNELKNRNNLNDIPLVVKKYFNLPIE